MGSFAPQEGAAYDRPAGPLPTHAPVDAEEQHDSLPVLVGDAPIARRVRLARGIAAGRSGGASVLPAVQAAAVAAGGFAAGAAVVGLLHRHQRRSPALSRGRRAGRALNRGRGAGAQVLQVVGTRTMLVDVHVLGTPGTER